MVGTVVEIDTPSGRAWWGFLRAPWVRAVVNFVAMLFASRWVGAWRGSCADRVGCGVCLVAAFVGGFSASFGGDYVGGASTSCCACVRGCAGMTMRVCVHPEGFVNGQAAKVGRGWGE